MEDVLERAGWSPAERAARGAPRQAGVRLVQSGYHCRSLSLYAKLGFQAREQLACVQGVRERVSVPGRAVRACAAGDVDSCCAL